MKLIGVKWEEKGQKFNSCLLLENSGRAASFRRDEVPFINSILFCCLLYFQSIYFKCKHYLGNLVFQVEFIVLIFC